MKVGFSYYDKVLQSEIATIQEKLNSLNTTEKVKILDGFARRVRPKTLSYREHLDHDVIKTLYKVFSAIEEDARKLMRGEMMISSSEIDAETGEVKTPAVYNKVPKTSTDLKNAITQKYAQYFTGPQITAILLKMVKYSKHNGTGDWTYYKEEVVK